MKGKILGTLLFFTLLIVVALYFSPYLKNMEGFSGSYPMSVDKAILDDYPQIGKNETSNKNYNQMWWRFPIFRLGSYKQITNNLKHRYSPDEGTCTRADFCDALYYNKKNVKSNVISMLPPAEEGEGARVGYFRTQPNELYFSIPTNENILY
jgi:hypothetical protein